MKNLKETLTWASKAAWVDPATMLEQTGLWVKVKGCIVGVGYAALFVFLSELIQSLATIATVSQNGG